MSKITWIGVCFCVSAGARIAHYMSANRLEDAILRLSAVLGEYSIVTINWDADSLVAGVFATPVSTRHAEQPCPLLLPECCTLAFVSWWCFSLERIKYKVVQTQCMAVVHDEFVPREKIHDLAKEAESLNIQVVPSSVLAQTADLQASPGLKEINAELAALEGLPRGKEEDTPKEPTGPERRKTHSPEERPPTSDSERLVVFTSGTTNDPKGVQLSYGNVATACRCILEAVGAAEKDISVDFVAVNPFHHVNTSVIFETALLCPRARIHLIDRYRTSYWWVLCVAAKLAAEAARNLGKETRSSPSSRSSSFSSSTEGEESFRVVAPLVSRHIDFLSALSSGDRFQQTGFLKTLREALAPKGVVLFLGSAPVGPSTVRTMQCLLGKLPRVRFGSTETALQVAAIPYSQTDEEVLEALERGWHHTFADSPLRGFYIGRPHTGLTALNIVKSVDAKADAYMADCGEGEPGYLICQGSNCMLGYANSSSHPFSLEGWYLGLGDVCFFLRNPRDQKKDFYWVTRATDMVMKGGANYSCMQINSDLQRFVASWLSVAKEDLAVATIGIKWKSEHDDDTCVTVELPAEKEAEFKSLIEEQLVKRAATEPSLPKGSRPDFVRVTRIPKTFKGAVDGRLIREEFTAHLQQTASELKRANFFAGGSLSA
ncbi:uncharacterized protein LOC34620129 [Cyclospora cayetanensis]|uniref:Uncharacterized protein LOC34620129 n=1 Tax=Cyclospora cayetanensis TaxID=88456 RepID=A0A6P6RWV6_9EIME|nr:uncharacterized protein LOC34620129 [Cyclospora cayetanensis]